MNQTVHYMSLLFLFYFIFFIFFMRDSEMVGMGDCWSAIGSHTRVATDGEVAAGQGRHGYGER